MAVPSRGEKVTDVEGIAKDWDSCEVVRDRLRGEKNEKGEYEGGPILAEGPKGADISTCVKNKGLMEPILTRMALQSSERWVPGVDGLKYELQLLLQRNKRGTDYDPDELSKSAWCLRKLSGFIKMKCRRREVSSATSLHLLKKGCV